MSAPEKAGCLPRDDGRTCGLGGDVFATEGEAEACEDGHHLAEEEMGVFDG